MINDEWPPSLARPLFRSTTLLFLRFYCHYHDNGSFLLVELGELRNVKVFPACQEASLARVALGEPRMELAQMERQYSVSFIYSTP